MPVHTPQGLQAWRCIDRPGGRVADIVQGEDTRLAVYESVDERWKTGPRWGHLGDFCGRPKDLEKLTRQALAHDAEGG
jgi:hypothetical protein